MDMLEATREEREAFDQLVASEFVVDSEHQDTLGWLIPYDHNTGRLIWMEELFKENPHAAINTSVTKSPGYPGVFGKLPG